MILEEDNRIRRITPLECCRLQGFPDNWCDDLGREDISEDELAEWREIFQYYGENVAHWKKPKTDKQILTFLRNPYSDKSAYKMWGNGVALPCVRFVMEGIAEFENE